MILVGAEYTGNQKSVSTFNFKLKLPYSICKLDPQKFLPSPAPLTVRSTWAHNLSAYCSADCLWLGIWMDDTMVLYLFYLFFWIFFDEIIPRT